MIDPESIEALKARQSVENWRKAEDAVKVACLDCGWSGCAGELTANACPVCDSRVREISAAPDFEAGYGLV